MTSTLKDGGDLDSMDRSLLNCEGMTAERLSLDPANLCLALPPRGEGGSGEDVTNVLRVLPTGEMPRVGGRAGIPAPQSEAEGPRPCLGHLLSPKTEAAGPNATPKRDTVVKFSAPKSSTRVLATPEKMDKTEDLKRTCNGGRIFLLSFVFCYCLSIFNKKVFSLLSFILFYFHT